jgi:hypothetical protein
MKQYHMKPDRDLNQTFYTSKPLDVMLISIYLSKHEPNLIRILSKSGLLAIKGPINPRSR